MNMIQTKRKPVAMEMLCTACFAPGQGSCNCGEPYLPAGQLADKIAKKFPELSTRQLEEKYGISHMTFARARNSGVTNVTPEKVKGRNSGVTNVTTEKVKGRDNKSYAKRKTKAPKKHYAEKDIVAARDRGLSLHRISKETGIGKRQVRHVVEREAACREAIEQAEPEIDAKVLSMSAQHKLDTARRQIMREMEEQYSERWRNEIGAHIKKLKEEMVPTWEKEVKSARIAEQNYRKLINDRKPIFSIEQFRLIIMCLHPDTYGQRSTEQVERAFDWFNKRKFQLTGQE